MVVTGTILDAVTLVLEVATLGAKLNLCGRVSASQTKLVALGADLEGLCSKHSTRFTNILQIWMVCVQSKEQGLQTFYRSGRFVFKAKNKVYKHSTDLEGLCSKQRTRFTNMLQIWKVCVQSKAQGLQSSYTDLMKNL